MKLDYYIERAERFCYQKPTTPTCVFANAATAPFPRENRSNKILMYGSRFVSPHLGHMSLLCQAHAATDDTVVAVMVVPNDSFAATGKLSLTKLDRKALWNHEVLDDFAWIHVDPAAVMSAWKGDRDREEERLEEVTAQDADTSKEGRLRPKLHCTTLTAG